MNEEPKIPWKKSWTGWRRLYPWLWATAATFGVVLVISLLLPGGPHGLAAWATTLACFLAGSAVMAAVFLGLWSFIRWVCSWRNLGRTVFVLACLVTIIGLIYAEEDWRGWHAWNRLKQQAEARGEHFDIAALTPPPVPADQNFAMTPLVASSYSQILTADGRVIPEGKRPTNYVSRLSLPVAHENGEPRNVSGDRARGKFTNLKLWQEYYRQQAAHTNEFTVPSQPGSPAADVLSALGKYNATVEELRADSRLPDSRFPLNYDSESPGAIYLPHLAGLKSCARLLQLRSAAELQEDQAGQALADIRLILDLSGKVRSEPFLITHLVRLAMVQLALQSIWEGLADHRWNDSQLATLDTELAKFDFLASYQLSMRGELVCQVGELEVLRRHPDQLQDLAYWDGGNGSGAGRFPLAGGVVARLIPAGWFYQNEYRCARIMLDFYLPMADVAQGTFDPRKGKAGDVAVATDTNSPSLFNLERMILPTLGRAATRFAYGQASVDCARVAVALERYRLAHGEYPETLGALTPEFLATVPADVMTGQPLKYRREDGHFVLYSVGWNQTDDGGNPVFTTGTSPHVDLEKGDWVWDHPQ